MRRRNEAKEMNENMYSEVTVEMKGITKTFTGVVANYKVDFKAEAGKIHAVLGENGAGKTTLMNILYGIYQPDEGEIFVKGRRVKLKSPRDAINLGIGMVHQHFMLIPPHSVAENIVLGLKGSSFFYPAEKIKKKLLEISSRYGLEINPDAKVWQLSVGEQQRVEILKTLFRGSDILILDEPTSVLTPPETKNLFKTLKKMADEGKTIIFITHKLEEVMNVSDEVTVLREGKVVFTSETSKTNKKELAKEMVGREILFNPELGNGKFVKDRVSLEVEKISVLNDKGLLALKNVSFTVSEGEILGVAGVAGNGQKELVEAITGLRKVLKGKIKILGKDLTNKSPREIHGIGVSHIPEERVKTGVVPNLSVMENVVLRDYYHPPFSNGFFLNWKFIRDYTQNLVDQYRILTPNLNTPVKLLSGGNIQRIILAREISRHPKLIIASHPTYGLDIAATEHIHRLLREQRGKGAAVLLVSEDLDEIMSLSDRVIVLFRGEIIGEFKASEAKIEEIGLMMAGVKG